MDSEIQEQLNELYDLRAEADLEEAERMKILIEDCKSTDLFDHLFENTITANLHRKEEIAKEFEVSAATVELWASGIAAPHGIIKSLVLEFLLAANKTQVKTA